MSDEVEWTFDEESPSEIATIVTESRDLDIAKSVLERDLKKAQRAGIDISQALRTLVTAHDQSRAEPWVLDIYGVGTVRGCRLIEAGYDELEAIAEADVESLTEIKGISRDYATVISEHAQELLGQRESTTDAIASVTNKSREQIERDLSSLGASGIAPSQAKEFLIGQYTASTPRLIDIDKVGMRIAYFLAEAGYDTPGAVAEASTEDLLDVRYIGQSNATVISESAESLVSSTADETEGGDLEESEDRETGKQIHQSSKRPSDSTYRIACFGGFTAYELVQDPDSGQELVSRIAEELRSDDINCVLYTGTRESTVDTVDMDFETAIEATVELFLDANFDAPVGFVLGAYDVYGASVESSITPATDYAEYPPFQTTGFPRLPDGIRYVPPDGVEEIAGVRLTQNPNLATQDTIHLTHRATEQVSADPRATVSGDGIHGYYHDNKLNTIAAAHDLGLTNETTPGGYHVLTVGPNGVKTEEFRRLGRVGQLECWEHTAMGRQYLHGPTECPYCENSAVQSETPGTAPLQDQAPSQTTWQSKLVASDQCGTDHGALNAYYHHHDVLRPAETTDEDVPAEMEAERELDTQALETGILQGEWIFSHSRDTVDEAWTQVLELVEDGVLYDARVNTKLHVELGDSDRYYLSVVVPNYFDRGEVRRVVRQLKSAGLVSNNLFFKPLLYSKWRITSQNKAEFDLQKSTRYQKLAE